MCLHIIFAASIFVWMRNGNNMKLQCWMILISVLLKSFLVSERCPHFFCRSFFHLFFRVLTICFIYVFFFLLFCFFCIIYFDLSVSATVRSFTKKSANIWMLGGVRVFHLPFIVLMRDVSSSLSTFLMQFAIAH